MKENILNLVIIGLGIWLVFFSKTDAKKAVEFQNKTFGYKFGKTEVTATKIGYIVGGIVLVAVGLLSLLGVIDFWTF